MITATLDELARAGIAQRPETVLADGGYWNSPQITALGRQGLTVIVPTKSATRTKGRTLSPRQGPEAERIDALLDTHKGAALYRQRQHIIETVFARTKVLRAHHQIPAPRPGRLPSRMAPDRHRPQPPQAPHRPRRLTTTVGRALAPRSPGPDIRPDNEQSPLPRALRDRPYGGAFLFRASGPLTRVEDRYLS